MKFGFYTIIIGLFLVGCAKVNHVATITPTQYKIGEIASNDSIAALIEPYKKQLDAQMNQVIGTCAKDLIKARPESTLGNWMSDALMVAAKKYTSTSIDISLVNYGGIRIPSLSKGDITKGKIFELMPFDNVMVIVELDGATLQVFFDHMAAKKGWPISEGIQYEIVDGKARNVTIQNKKIDINQTYRVLLSDYIANGGDRCNFLIDRPKENLGVFIRDALIGYVQDVTKRGELIDSNLEKRVVNK